MTLKERTPGSWTYRFQIRRTEYTGGGYPTRRSAQEAGEARRAALLDQTNQARAALADILDQASRRTLITVEQIEQIRAILLPDTLACSPLGKLLETYEAASHLDAAKPTRKANANALLNILRTVKSLPQSTPAAAKASNERLRQLNTRDALDPAHLRAWFDHHATAASRETQTRARQIKESANSIVNAALGLITPRARQAYTDAGLILPDTLDKLTATYQANRFRLPRKDYHPPQDDIVAATLEDWAQLEDRNLFLAIGYSLAFGLRKSEIIRAEWDWHTTRAGYATLDAATDTKSGTGRITVKALDPFYTTLITRARNRDWWQPSGPILTGTPTETTNYVWRRLSDWLGERGWETTKRAHALRAYAGSAVAMRYGIAAARDFLRHATSTVTEQHYAHFVDNFRAEDPETLPWSWARTDTAPQIAAVA